jgi:hypothetical protein
MPMDADENAAANIGLWFLRGREDFRVRINGSGIVLTNPQFVAASKFLQDTIGNCWRPEEDGKGKTPTESYDASDQDDDEDRGEGQTLFRDPSGKAFDKDCWYEASSFWGRIASIAGSAIEAANAERFATDDD